MTNTTTDTANVYNTNIFFGTEKTGVPYIVSVDNAETLESNEDERTPYIKAIGNDRIGCYAILWGDENNKDMHGEYFTEKTADLTAVLDTIGAIPTIFEHGQDDKVMKSHPFAAVDKAEYDDTGLWIEAQIKRHDLYKQFIQPLIQQRVLFPSSGTLPAAKRVTKSGEITRWPIVELTATAEPAEYRMLDIPMTELQGVYKSIGVDLPDDILDEPEPEAEKVVNESESIKSAKLRELEQMRIQYLKFDLESRYDY
jgi:hypothetical protein